MPKYDKDIRKIIDSSKIQSSSVVMSTKLGVSDYDLRFLEAKGFVKTTFYNGVGYQIEVLPACITYFDDKKQKRNDFLKQFFSNFICGFITGVVVAFIVQKLGL